MESYPQALQARAFFALSPEQAPFPLGLAAPAWELLATMRSWLENKESYSIRCPLPEGVWLKNAHLIEAAEGCVIEPGSYLCGPCVLGAGTHVRHGAYVRGFVVTGRDCLIGHATELKNALLLDRAKAAHFAYLGDTVLGFDVNLGAGVKCANLRLDQRPIEFVWQGCSYATQLQKLGAMVGDRSQVGCNSVLNPGTLLPPDSRIAPLQSVCGLHACKRVGKKGGDRALSTPKRGP